VGYEDRVWSAIEEEVSRAREQELVGS